MTPSRRHSTSWLAGALVVLTLIIQASTAPPHAGHLIAAPAVARSHIELRQVTSSSPPATISSSAGTTTASSSASTGSTTSVTPGNSKHSQLTTSLSNTISLSTATVSTHSDASSTTSASATLAPNQLPLQPEITPAFAVGGVLLILTGIPYMLIGVRNRWLYVFGSSAYLVSLSIVVLITYMCHPPISNTVQGAYLVAAVVPACLLGGLSIIFIDVVEGLGCLLGGFCLSMWFLELSPGGLIQSSNARTAFIISLSVAAFLLFFSRYTRTYALMGSISFSGATSVILGIDCFSRAGLKEFWTYLWDLNSSLFPAGTNTYPVTRDIKVEIAGTVVLCAAGIISQLKLWKVIKERREKKAAARMQDAEERDNLEAQIGRRVEASALRERSDWERQYGEKNQSVTSSELANSPPGSASWPSSQDSSPRAMKDEANEANARATERSNANGVLSSWHNQTSSAAAHVIGSHNGEQSDPDALNVSRSPSVRSYVVHGEDDEGQWEEKPISTDVQDIPASPEVKPLPFRVPSENLEPGNLETENDDAKSLATAGDIETVEDTSVRIPSRNQKRNSTRHLNDWDFGVPALPEAMSSRSSLAATLDGDAESMHRLSAQIMPYELQLDQGESALRRVKSSSSLQNADNARDSKSKEGGESFLESGTVSRRHSIDGLNVKRQSSRGSVSDAPKPQREHSITGSERSLDRPQSPLLKREHLPQAQSHTVLLYRTNEWAKHQVVADKPALYDVAPPSESGVRVEVGPQEYTKPVNVAALQHSAFETQQPAKTLKITPPVMRSHSPNGNSPRSSSVMSYVTALNEPRTRSLLSPRGSVARPSLSPIGSATRVVAGSKLAHETLLESPSEDSVVTPTSSLPDSGPSPTLSPRPSSTLLGHRSSMLQSRLSTTSFVNLAAPLKEASDTGSDADNVSLSSRRRALLGDNLGSEDMPLALRRELIRQNSLKSGLVSASSSGRSSLVASDMPRPLFQTSSHHSYRVSRQPSSPLAQSSPVSTLPIPAAAVSVQASAAAAAAAASAGQFNSHQPLRSPATMSAVQRESRLASWRASIAQENQRRSSTVHTANVVDERRAALLQDRNAVVEAAQVRAARETAVDERMRQADMLQLHQEAMKRLQGSATGASA